MTARMVHLSLRYLLAVTLAGVTGVMAPPSGAADRAAATPAATSAAARPALTVSLVSPQSGDWPQRLVANGNVMAWQEAVIGAEGVGLRLTEVRVNVGDSVKRGQLLARLNDSTVAADVAQTRASLAEAQASADEARANADRARELRPTGVISAQQVLQALTTERTALARVDALKARLDAEQLRLSQTRVLAPDNGQISARSATVGAVTQPGQELFRLIRGGRLEWRAEVPAAELARIRAGMAARITPVGGPAVPGRVRRVAPTVDANTRNGLVYVDLPAPGDARAGMFARGEFELGQAKGLTLPQSAVVLRDGFSYVFRLTDASRVSMVKVATGRRVGDRIEILSGIDADVRVVANGGGFLSDGDTVRVVEAAPTAPVAGSAATGARQ